MADGKDILLLPMRQDHESPKPLGTALWQQTV
jgi:hypothetical protein